MGVTPFEFILFYQMHENPEWEYQYYLK